MHQLAQWGQDRSPFKSKDVKYIIWSLFIFLLEFTALKHLVFGTLIADQLDSRALFCELLQASEKTLILNKNLPKKTKQTQLVILNHAVHLPKLSSAVTMLVCLPHRKWWIKNEGKIKTIQRKLNSPANLLHRHPHRT